MEYTSTRNDSAYRQAVGRARTLLQRRNASRAKRAGIRERSTPRERPAVIALARRPKSRALSGYKVTGAVKLGERTETDARCGLDARKRPPPRGSARTLDVSR